MRRTKNMPPEEILYLLNRKGGWTYAEVDRIYGLKSGIARWAARCPHLQGELAIAEVLGMSPRQIWPGRFDSATGKRLRPQPAAHYRPAPRLRLRKKNTEG
ncbi:MAG: transcriptional regulator [Sphingomonadales bacterium]